MIKKVILILGLLMVTCGLVRAGIQATAQGEKGCPDGYVSVITLAPIQLGEFSSRVARQECRPVEEAVETEMIQPMSPGEFEAARPPDEWADQGEAVNGMVTEPSDDSGYRCVVLLEPIQPG